MFFDRRDPYSSSSSYQPYFTSKPAQPHNILESVPSQSFKNKWRMHLLVELKKKKDLYLLPARDDSIKEPAFKIFGEFAEFLENWRQVKSIEADVFRFKLIMFFATQYVQNQRNPFLKNYVSSFGFIKQLIRLFMHYFT